MINTVGPVVLKLVMLICMDSQCAVENAYEVDKFRGNESDAMADCLPFRDARRQQYAEFGITGVEFHCWTPAELKLMGFN